MEKTLADFCGISGQRVNHQKSNLWLSPNTYRILRGNISREFQALIIDDLGVYLDMPLVHARASVSLYERWY